MDKFKEILDGNWTITYDLFKYICDNFPSTSYPNILELGGGKSTKCWAEMGYNITSIEHDATYLNEYSIHAPLTNDYYNEEILKQEINRQNWDILIIDGPPGKFNSRHKFQNYIDINNFKVIVIDDIHRVNEAKIFDGLKHKGWQLKIINHSKSPKHMAGILYLEFNNAT